MLARNPSQDAKAIKIFKKKKVLMIEELSGLLDSSLITARRRLKQWKTYTSYNHNGRYYVLPGVVKFDTHGLWRHQDILFSQHGNWLRNYTKPATYSMPKQFDVFWTRMGF